MIIYITFPDDADTGYAYTIWDKPQPPSVLNTKPINPYTGTSGRLIDSLVGNPSDPFMTRYHNYTLSDFFCEMSMGTYDVIGDEIAITLPHTSQYYDSLPNFAMPELNRLILNYLDSTRNIDWSRYDNWSKSTGSWVFGTPDDTAEMIIMNYRTIPNISSGWFWSSDVGGIGNLGFTLPITFESTTIDCNNGITVLNLGHATGRSEALLEHEFSHKLFGASFQNSSDIGLHLNIGFMTKTTSNTTYIMTPMERSDPAVNYIPVNLINSTGIYTDTLPDYTESGISYKIQIPGTTTDYFWIANHQKKSLYDGVARGGKNCYDINFAEIDPFCSDGKGLFVYHRGVSCYENINSPYDVISAEGKYIWGTDRTVHVPRQNYHFPMNQNITIFNIITASRYHGRDEYRKSVNFTEQFLADDICSNDTNDYFVAWENRGDNFDAFNIGYEEIFSPYSNPATGSCDSTLTGLTIALMEQNSTTGAIIVKIYYNNDAQALADLPPSKPKNVKVTKEYFGGSSGPAFQPKITWDQNIEPDFLNASAGPTGIVPAYEIYRGHSTDCGTIPEFSLITTVSSSVTVFIDSLTILYDPDNGNPLNCYSNMTAYSYKILSKDNRGNRSLKSERGLIRGYANSCSESQGPDNYLLNSDNDLPKEFSLKQNYPNPFNPETNIQYDLPSDNFVSIKIFDITGKEITTLVNEFKTAGRYSIGFNGSNLASGIYYYKIEAGNFTQVRKMILLK